MRTLKFLLLITLIVSIFINCDDSLGVSDEEFAQINEQVIYRLKHQNKHWWRINTILKPLFAQEKGLSKAIYLYYLNHPNTKITDVGRTTTSKFRTGIEIKALREIHQQKWDKHQLMEETNLTEKGVDFLILKYLEVLYQR